MLGFMPLYFECSYQDNRILTLFEIHFYTLVLFVNILNLVFAPPGYVAACL